MIILELLLFDNDYLFQILYIFPTLFFLNNFYKILFNNI